MSEQASQGSAPESHDTSVQRELQETLSGPWSAEDIMDVIRQRALDEWKSQPENQELAKSVSTNISAEVSNLIVERVEKRKKAGFEAFKIGRNVLRLVAATTWDQQLTLIEHFGGMMTPDQISSLINVEGAIKHAIHQAMLVEKVRKVIEVYQERMGEPFITLYHMTLQLDKDFYEWKKSLVAAEARQIKVELDAEREQSGA